MRAKEVVQRGSCRYDRASLSQAGLSSLKHCLAGKTDAGILPGFLCADELLCAPGRL